MGSRPYRASRRILLLLGIALAQPSLAQTIPSAALPAGIPALADRRQQCFLPGEKAQYDAAIDATRVSVPGCSEGVIPPQTMVQSDRVYAQGSSSVVDCASMRQNEFGTRYLDTFRDELVAEVDQGNPACAAGMLSLWAKAGAMTEISTEGWPNQSKADIMWTLAGISAAYLTSPSVQAAARADKSDAAIRGWFDTLSGPVSDMIDTVRAQHKENNLQYWRAYAILPTALLNGNAALLQQSRGVFSRAMQAVTTGNPDPSDDGYLTRELRRGDKALAYQDFASQPLVGMVTLSQAYGCEFLRPADRPQLVSLMARTVQGSFDPGIFSEQQAERALGSGEEMDGNGGGRASPRLLYLINRFDPALYAQIDKTLAQELGKPRPVIAASYGADAVRPQLGGRLDRLADGAAALRGAPSPKLAKVCGQS
ncbi:MAG: alginate lyase family protein [Amaricoccus sp.]